MAAATIDGYLAEWRRLSDGTVLVEVRQPGTHFGSTHGCLCAGHVPIPWDGEPDSIAEKAIKHGRAMLAQLFAHVRSSPSVLLPMWIS